MAKLEFFKAIKALRNGEIIVYPTDTLYGLGADIYNGDAVRKIFKIKKRPFNDPLPVAVSDIEEIEKIAYIDDKSCQLAKAFLPGRLTLILKKRNSISDIVTGGLEKVAVRIPDNKIALELLSEFGPLTATSANIHGKKTPDIIREIRMQFKNEDVSVYLNVGRVAGKPSTIVDATNNHIKIVREGAITEKEILDAISYG
jgi:L-threonylcarbamoyladenylate synthase